MFLQSDDDKWLKRLAIANSMNRLKLGDEIWKAFVLSWSSCTRTLPDRLCLPRWALTEQELPVCLKHSQSHKLPDRTVIVSVLRQIFKKRVDKSLSWKSTFRHYFRILCIYHNILPKISPLLSLTLTSIFALLISPSPYFTNLYSALQSVKLSSPNLLCF